MRVFYPKSHALHRPKTEDDGKGGRIKAYEVPGRIQAILAGIRRLPFVRITETGPGRLTDAQRVHLPWMVEDIRLGTGIGAIDPWGEILPGTYRAALASVTCAVRAAEHLAKTGETAYALCRPPGHHAGRNFYGGYCYFNNTASAVKYLAEKGKVAILDLDYHMGNGTQDIFKWRKDVLVASIHAETPREYPGEAYTEITAPNLVNLPLPLKSSRKVFFQALELALVAIREFKPRHLVVSIGYDIHKSDPQGGLGLAAKDFLKVGERLKMLGLPLLVIQEGGYHLGLLGTCARELLLGLEGKGTR
jgi:acetoin utilization deacetylase AcuC-like enzyme